jgi:hypothetical protein
MSLRGERPAWDFDYAPISIGGERGADAAEGELDVIVATEEDLDPARVAELASSMAARIQVTSLFSSHPIFWTRVEASSPIDQQKLGECLARGGVKIRYVASARHGSQALPPPLDLEEARPRRAADWALRKSSDCLEAETPWRWFLRERGVDVDRRTCGTGAGTRLAVIDNDAESMDQVKLDAEVLIGVSAAPRTQTHAAMMLAWAVNARMPDGGEFRGVAPDASPRFYCIPKPSEDVWSLPLAIVRAAEDGADVIVCATYLEGSTSPLLDDAVEFATRLGRGGRGTALVMPTGREMSSPADSVHCSLSLGLADPAADPRIFCIGPSARDGGWFLWRDRKGKLRPFANRGPSVRWLAPGDDMAFPFATPERPWHAESSGASGVAAGALLLLLGTNPELTLTDIDALLTATAVEVDGASQVRDPELADRRDLEPAGVDGDGHNAKHGYGRISALLACRSACDPFCFVLSRMGEHEAASGYLELRADEEFSALYSPALARFAARAVLRDAELRHALTAFARALRLAARHPERAADQVPGHLIRQVALIARALARRSPPADVARELALVDRTLRELLQSNLAAATEAEFIARLGASCGWSRKDLPSSAYSSIGVLHPRTEPRSRSSQAKPAGGPSAFRAR